MKNDKLKLIYDALDDKKAHDIAVIDISNVSIMADYFVIADGENRNQVQAMAGNVEDEMLKAGYHYKALNGYPAGSWILMDYQDIVVHVFHKDDRLFYDLERLWRDGRRIFRDEIE